MQPSAYNLKSFYQSREGRIIRRVIREHILEIWPNLKTMRVMGYGYALPYLKPFAKDAERIFAAMPTEQGAHHWNFESDKNLTCLCTASELPFETNSIDRAILIHDLEFSELPASGLAEIWRVLKSNGRMLVVVPNRGGLWSRAEWTPLGQGRPYSHTQLYKLLDDNLFTHEQTRDALYVPPIRWRAVMNTAPFFEKLGRWLPLPAGVHIVEASKQLYARADKGHGAKVRSRRRAGLIPKPAMPFSNSKDYSDQHHP